MISTVGALAYWQRNNIMALKYALGYSQEELQAMSSQNDEKILEILEKIPESEAMFLSPDVLNMLSTGELTEEEAVTVITGKSSLDEVIKQRNQPKKNDDSDEDKKGENANIQELIARIYALRGSYVGQLNGLVAQAKAEFLADKSRRGEIEGKYMSLGSSLEASCDAQIESILSQMRAELEKSGGDLGIISEIRSVYANEKSIKKAEIFSQYK